MRARFLSAAPSVLPLLLLAVAGLCATVVAACAGLEEEPTRQRAMEMQHVPGGEDDDGCRELYPVHGYGYGYGHGYGYGWPGYGYDWEE